MVSDAALFVAAADEEEAVRMHRRLLSWLRCPECTGTLEVVAADGQDSEELSDGLLRCDNEHWFPVVEGIPRMLPDAVDEHWEKLQGRVSPSTLQSLATAGRRNGSGNYDRRTQTNFSSEWEHYQIGDRTWGMELDDRVKWFFVDPIRIPPEELEGKVVLDAGCGNGSQSVAYTRLGLEVLAVDLSSGLARGQELRHRLEGARPDRVHFVQADLRYPPFAPSSVDIIHSAGVLQATPDTEATFRTLCRLLKPGGTFYTWVLKYEPVVTPIVNGLRGITTRLPSDAFAKVAKVSAPAFMVFCRAADRLGIRHYPLMTRREATLALFDIFGAPYAHYHSYPELVGWYESEGFEETWPCNDDRRGFGVCGRKGDNRDATEEHGRRSSVPERPVAPDDVPAHRT